MMGSSLRKYMVFCLVAAAMTMAGLAEAQVFKLQLEKGFQYESKVTANTNMKQTIMGTESDVVTRMFQQADHEVIDVNEDGVMAIRSITRRITMETEMMGVSTKIDTEVGKTDGLTMENAALMAMIDTPTTLTMDPTGKILAIEGWDKINSRMAENYKQVLPPEMAGMMDQMVTQMSTMMNDDTMLNSMNLMSNIYPEDEKPMEPGQFWTKDMYATQPMPMSMEMNFRYQGIEEGRGILEMTGLIGVAIDASSGILKSENMDIDSSLNGECASIIEFNPETGLILQSDMNQTMQGSTTVNGTEIPMDMTMKMGMVNTPK